MRARKAPFDRLCADWPLPPPPTTERQAQTFAPLASPKAENWPTNDRPSPWPERNGEPLAESVRRLQASPSISI